jgi:serpin B
MKTKCIILSGVLSCSLMVQAGMSSPGVQKVVAENTGFAVDLYAKLRAQDGNLFFSPYSISTALAMTYAGARGQTADQMARTLRFDLPPDELHPAFAALADGLNAVQSQGQVKLAIANSLWPQEGYIFRPDFLDLCQKDYGTSINPVDYAGDPEHARRIINRWVEKKTNDKIVDLLQPGVLDPSNRLVLVNAIYFKGNWVNRFDPGLTADQPFYTAPDKTVTAPLMHQTDEFGYAEFPGLQVLSLPYRGGDVSMVVLLPRQRDGIGGLETQLTPENLATWTANPVGQKVHVSLPKFKTTAEFSLGDTLAAMGMSDAFDPDKADFSGMDGTNDLYISKVIHQAYVDVDEQGTEAAAATAVVMTLGMAMSMQEPPIPTFRADHPFLFLIRDNRTGSILFLGRIMDPTQ